MRIKSDFEMSLDKVSQAIFGVKTACGCGAAHQQLALGIAVEMEHTSDPHEAEKIARDHLAEDKNYYTSPKKKNWGIDEAKGRADELDKTASSQPMRLKEDITGESVDVFKGSNKEPHFTITGTSLKNLDVDKIRDYLYGVDWTDRGTPGWIHPIMRCDDFLTDEFSNELRQDKQTTSSDMHGLSKQAASGSQQQEAFWCLLAGMPKSDVIRKYNLQPSDFASIDNMAEASHHIGITELAKIITKEQLPTAYQGLWDNYHKGQKASKTAQTSGLKDCQRCKGKGGYFAKLRNLGTGDFSEHYVPCDMPGCNHGKYDPSILCPECHDPDGREKTIQEISHKIANTDLKTWSQIRDEQDPDGKNHDLRLVCKKCGNETTCRCSKPKRRFEGICDECAGKTASADLQLSKTADESVSGSDSATVVSIVNYVMRYNNATQHELVSLFGITLPQSDAILRNLMPTAFGPGGKGYDWFVKQVDRVLKNSTDQIPRQASVFVLEDDPARIVIFKAAFGDDNVTVTKDVKTALDLLRTRKFAKVFLDRDLSSPNETGEDVAWQMEREAMCRTTPIVIHSENTRGQKVMARYLGRYHSNVKVIPFNKLRKSLEIPGGVKL